MEERKLTRRDFLRVSALTAAGTALAACAPKAAEEVAEPATEPEEAQEAYGEFVEGCGLHNGEHWQIQVGEAGDDSVIESYIGADKAKTITQALYDVGLKNGDYISLVLAW